MADNVTADPGTGGATFKTDEDTGASAHVPVTKIELGANNTFDGFVASGNPMPSQLTDGTDAIATAVEDAAAAANPAGLPTMAVRDDLLQTDLVGTDGDYVAVRAANTGSLYTAPGNFVSTNNSTTATLGVSANFTGTGDDCAGYSSVAITLYADVASSANGMTFQFSTDNSNWDDTYSFTMAAGETRRFQFPVTARYFRVNYTNGGSGQSAFRVQTILHATPITTSIHRIADDVDPDRSATLVKSVLVAQLAGSGDFTPVDATSGGNLKVSIEEGVNTPTDNYATPTDAVNAVAINMVYDGSTWDFARGDATNGLLVDLGANNDVAASQSGTWNITNISGTVSLPTGAATETTLDAVKTAVELIDNAIYVDDADWTDSTSSHMLVGGLYQTSPQSITDGDVGPIQVDANGNVIESNSAAILADTANIDTNVGTIAGAVSGGQMQVDIVADGAGLLTTSAHDAAFGTAGTADAQVRSVQGIAGMTPVVVDLGSNNDVTLATLPDTAGSDLATISGDTTSLDGKLPAAAAAADNFANPTTTNVMSMGMVWDGATWDRAPGTSADGLTVNLGSNNDVGINAGTNMIGRVEQNVSVSATGTTTFYDEDLDETAVAADAGAVNIYSIQAFNTTDAPLFLQLFNVASGSVTVGTTKPTNQYVIPGNANSDGAGFSITFSVPKTYDTALTVACTTNSEGNGAPGAGACIVNIELAT